MAQININGIFPFDFCLKIVSDPLHQFLRSFHQNAVRVTSFLFVCSLTLKTEILSEKIDFENWEINRFLAKSYVNGGFLHLFPKLIKILSWNFAQA